MDPSLTNPPATTAECNQLNCMSSAVNPAATNGHGHPSYPEMVLDAIEALKEKDGSSRQAIAKYIEQFYTDLPSDNSVLLTRHLKWMKQAGQLIMVKHSYMIPGSASFISQSDAPGNEPAAVIPEPIRRSGRPPKPNAEYQLLAVPPSAKESIFVSLGLDDGPVPSPPVSQDEIDVAHAHSVFGKRGRGRPPKLKPVDYPVEKTAPASQNGSKRKRGRPRKHDSNPMKVPKPTGTGTPRGRPPKYLVLSSVDDGDEQDEVSSEELWGPKKGSLLKKSRRLSGKPLGRPRKQPLIGREGGANQNQVQSANDNDIIKKLEYIRNKVKQVVSAVKPHLNSITAANALKELQELEQLVDGILAVQANPVDNPPPQITIVSQKPVLVPPPAHFSVPTSVPIAAPDIYPISYSTFQAAYQAQSLH